MEQRRLAGNGEKERGREERGSRGRNGKRKRPSETKGVIREKAAPSVCSAKVCPPPLAPTHVGMEEALLLAAAEFCGERAQQGLRGLARR